ncbi:MAG: hypothetical protein AAFX09_11655 [Pseudomonadota bacterium]
MHILFALLGAIGAIAFFLWRINMGVRAARELADAAGEAANLPRKMRFRSRSKKRGVDVIDDAREAGAVILYGAAKSAGEVDSLVKAFLSEAMSARFNVDAASAAELTARAAWHLNSLNDPVSVLNRMTDLVASQAGADALADLDAVMAELGEGGPVDADAFERYRAQYRRRAGLGSR